MLETRIRRGDYTIRELPTEHELAEEMGSSRMTARRILQRLVEQGIVVRKPHGRLEVNRRYDRLSNRLRVALLTPANSSPNYAQWHLELERAAARWQATVRAIDYVHWDDPVVIETLSNYDGVFLVPSSDPVPPEVQRRFSEAQHLVTLDENMSEWGVPSLQLLPGMFVHQLGDHLYGLGHRRISCLNTQPHVRLIQERIEQWAFWCRMHKVEGRMLDEPVESYGDAMRKAYAVMTRALDAGEFRASALVCITGAACTGAIRAFHEHGYQVGKDVSVCSVDGEATARMLVPSRTVLEPPDPGPYLDACLVWMGKKTEPWVGPLLVQPASVTLFAGESTGPCPTEGIPAPSRPVCVGE